MFLNFDLETLHNKLGLFYYHIYLFLITYIRIRRDFMYYYGGYSGYGCQPVSGYGQAGYSGAIILVLFILLVIIIGSRTWNN